MIKWGKNLRTKYSFQELDINVKKINLVTNMFKIVCKNKVKQLGLNSIIKIFKFNGSNYLGKI
jgi:hypothetical protein